MMKRPIFFALFFFFFLFAQVQAAGSEFTYQGRIELSGQPFNGALDLRFDIYDVQSEGAPLTNEILKTSVNVIDGLISQRLDFGTVPFDGRALWLEISVRESGTSDEFVVLAPRQKITSAPYSIHAQSNDSMVETTTNAGDTVPISDDSPLHTVVTALDDGFTGSGTYTWFTCSTTETRFIHFICRNNSFCTINDQLLAINENERLTFMCTSAGELLL